MLRDIIIYYTIIFINFILKKNWDIGIESELYSISHFRQQEYFSEQEKNIFSPHLKLFFFNKNFAKYQGQLNFFNF